MSCCSRFQSAPMTTVQVLIAERVRSEPFRGQPALPAATYTWMRTLIPPAPRGACLPASSACRAPYLEQLCSFGGRARDPRGWSINIACRDAAGQADRDAAGRRAGSRSRRCRCSRSIMQRSSRGRLERGCVTRRRIRHCRPSCSMSTSRCRSCTRSIAACSAATRTRPRSGARSGAGASSCRCPVPSRRTAPAARRSSAGWPARSCGLRPDHRIVAGPPAAMRQRSGFELPQPWPVDNRRFVSAGSAF